MSATIPSERAAPDAKLARRVLIVDDDREFAEALSESLDRNGHQVTIASGVDDVLKVAREFEPKAVLVDLQFGQGMDLVPALRKLLPDVLCLVVTAYPDLESAIQAIRYRVDDYLRKPVSPEDVARALERCFAHGEAAKYVAAGHARRNLFGRLLVERFVHLFAENGGLPVDEGAVSRRMLPGFFDALSKMLGPVRIAESQEKCRRILEQLGDGRIDESDWEEFLANTEAKGLARDAEVSIALHFRDFEKRTIWFTNLVNTNLAPPAPGSAKEILRWQLSEKATVRLLHALFADLRDEMTDEAGRLEFIERYGADTYAWLAETSFRVGRLGKLH